ncbi:hypothetical protein GCM10009700_34730 [Brevibacterium sanguinis]
MAPITTNSLRKAHLCGIAHDNDDVSTVPLSSFLSCREHNAEEVSNDIGAASST